MESYIKYGRCVKKYVEIFSGKSMKI